LHRGPHVLPLIGVPMSETWFAMISDWMANGNISNFVKKNPGVNRLELVGLLFATSSSSLRVIDIWITHLAEKCR